MFVDVQVVHTDLQCVPRQVPAVPASNQASNQASKQVCKVTAVVVVVIVLVRHLAVRGDGGEDSGGEGRPGHVPDRRVQVERHHGSAAHHTQDTSEQQYQVW